MAVLISGTTPTISIKFKTIPVGVIAVAYLVFKVGSRNIFEKSLSEAVVTEEEISWTLSQEESLEIGKLCRSAKVDVVCDWRTTDGTRGRSVVVPFVIERSGKDVVI